MPGLRRINQLGNPGRFEHLYLQARLLSEFADQSVPVPLHWVHPSAGQGPMAGVGATAPFCQENPAGIQCDPGDPENDVAQRFAEG